MAQIFTRAVRRYGRFPTTLLVFAISVALSSAIVALTVWVIGGDFFPDLFVAAIAAALIAPVLIHVVIHALGHEIQLRAHGSDREQALIAELRDQKSIEAALRKSEQQFRDYTAAASDRLWETDENHRFVYASSPPRDTPRVPSKQMIGKTRWELPGSAAEGQQWRKYRADMEARRPIKDFVSLLSG